jgi:hypothetical protein
MADIQWTNAVSGEFGDSSDWTGGVVPGASDEAILDTPGPAYVVTADYDAVAGLDLASNATLVGFDFTVTGAVRNKGVLEGGDLMLEGPVTGSGTAIVAGNGNSIEASGPFSENVTFAEGAGELELAQSHSYTGTITGFGATGRAWHDLQDIEFIGLGEASFTENSTSTGGVLTVSDAALRRPRSRRRARPHRCWL